MAMCLSSIAQTNSTPAAATLDKGSEKRTRAALEAANLNDASKEGKVHDIVYDYLTALKTWHETNDAQLKTLWAAFGADRNTHDAAKIQAGIDALEAQYASFKPVHDDFEAKLTAAVSPEQIEAIKDAFTVKKVEVTFNAYQQIFHGLTADQNAVILKYLKDAREEAIDAEAMTEKSAFFKKWKDKIEAYLTAQGYDVKKSYEEFTAKQKAEAGAKAAKKSAKAAKGTNGVYRIEGGAVENQ